MRILLVEDDDGLGSAVRDQIHADGHLGDWVETLEDARASIAAMDYDMILLDLMLPDGSGFVFLREIRAAGRRVPVIILTAMDRVSDRIRGLNDGADDYLVKPFDLSELSARIAAVARRASGDPNPWTALGKVRIDLAARRAVMPRGDVALSANEWVVLETLLRNRGKIVARDSIEDRLYAFGAGAESNTLEVFVSRLRRKLGHDTIETHRGLGYRIPAAASR